MLIDDVKMKEARPVYNGQCILSERAPLTTSEGGSAEDSETCMPTIDHARLRDHWPGNIELNLLWARRATACRSSAVSEGPMKDSYRLGRVLAPIGSCRLL
eukprot:11080127-Heterocapsa_arctica.AAC.1